MLRGRILITGGAGFLGRAIMARARRERWDARFTIYSRDEQKQAECRRKFPDARYVLGDIRDFEKLRLLCQFHDIVIHAAALKYIPESEFNVNEAIGINVGGTQTVVQAVRETSVRTVVFVSTDKAVEPLNTYGFTKALGERVMFEAAQNSSDIKFTSVRYGNVIGSTGSVVPVLKAKAAELGLVPITDPKMSRFWISAEEAIDLILWAAENSTPGSVTIPRPKAMMIGEVAEAIAPGIPQNIVGMRPGEKLYEKLVSFTESVRTIQVGPNGSYYEYWQQAAARQDIAPFELSSHNADRMTVDEFRAHVEAAELI